MSSLAKAEGSGLSGLDRASTIPPSDNITRPNASIGPPTTTRVKAAMRRPITGPPPVPAGHRTSLTSWAVSTVTIRVRVSSGPAGTVWPPEVIVVWTVYRSR